MSSGSKVEIEGKIGPKCTQNMMQAYFFFKEET
jgi:hypothetical protein